MPLNKACHLRTVQSISEELFKRFVLPFYTLIISLIAASLIIEPKYKYFVQFHKINIFLVGVGIIILSQLSLKFFLISINFAYLVFFLPILLVLFYYIFLLIFTRFKLKHL